MTADWACAEALFPQAPLEDSGHLRVACSVVQQPVRFAFSMMTFRGPLATLLNAWMEVVIWFLSGNSSLSLSLSHTHTHRQNVRIVSCTGAQEVRKTAGFSSLSLHCNDMYACVCMYQCACCHYRKLHDSAATNYRWMSASEWLQRAIVCLFTNCNRWTWLTSAETMQGA